MNTILKKATILAVLVALFFAALPLSASHAAGLNETTTPPAPGSQADPEVVKARLEMIFGRQQMRVMIIGQLAERFDLLSANVQRLLDKASEKGLDVSEVKAAFEAFKDAFEKGKPIYSQAKDLVSKHAGFDSAGKVVDIEQAKSTVKSIADVSKQYRETVGKSFRALREAIKDFRSANPRHTPAETPAP